MQRMALQLSELDRRLDPVASNQGGWAMMAMELQIGVALKAGNFNGRVSWRSTCVKILSCLPMQTGACSLSRPQSENKK